MSDTYIGATISIVASTPATEDQSGYEALSYTEIGKIVSFGELGDESEDITWTLLKTGRVKHANGAKDLGEIAVAVEFDASDAGITIVEAGNNGNTIHSVKVTDPDGEDSYFQAKIANLRDLSRDGSTYKGKTFVLRGTSGVTVVDA